MISTLAWNGKRCGFDSLSRRNISPFEELFSKNVLTANSKIDVVMPMPSSEIMFFGKELFRNMCICEKALYQNTIFELDIGTARSFVRMALNAFWKRGLHFNQLGLVS